MEYEAVIGLEVHAQLKTRSKLFCASSTRFGMKPNENTCPIDLGLPGVLPVLNKHAVDLAIKAGLALNCNVQTKSVWERKNYFYPDLPKGYQITQYEKPICLGGHLIIDDNGKQKKINLTRIHMEEDAGRLLHDFGDSNSSHVDLNRAGIPLIEIVSEPDMNSSHQASQYLKNLRAILCYCDVCDGNMEEGSIRCDANISIKPANEKKLGTKVELKNINSFKFLEKAIDYEIERQKMCLASGEKIVQETRLWNSGKNITESMRSKEDAHDYRYFPDPDLVPLIVDDQWIQKMKKELPELPEQKIKRFINDYHLSEYDARVLTDEKDVADYFEEALRALNEPKKLANWIMTELLRELGKSQTHISTSPVKPKQLANLITLINTGEISGKMAKDVFLEMYASAKDAEKIIKEKGLSQVSDTKTIENVVDQIIKANPEQAAQYKSGKIKVFGFFVGQVMREMKGQANPQVVNDLLKKKLSP